MQKFAELQTIVCSMRIGNSPVLIRLVFKTDESQVERKKSGAPFAMRITVRTYNFEINGCIYSSDATPDSSMLIRAILKTQS